MLRRVRRTFLFGLHQATVALGIALFPLVLAVRRAGLPLPIPIQRLVQATGTAYERAAE